MGNLRGRAQSGIKGHRPRIQACEVIDLKRRLEELYVVHTGKSIEVAHDMDRDLFTRRQEATACGIIDTVITHPDTIHTVVAS
jgi:ATP-dependent protease ClpP protease subunit